MNLTSLVGEQLSAVSFVQDYVEFHFDGPIIRALTDPIAESPAGRWQFPATGSRDALCLPISRTVQNVVFRDGDQLALDFGDGYRITIPLDPASAPSGEVMHFQVAPTAPLRVW